MRNFVFCVLGCVFAVASSAATITFDDIQLDASGYAQIQNGYQGLNWSNFMVRPGTVAGYANGMVSAPNVAYNSNAGEASVSAVPGQTFNLTDGFFAGAWMNGLNIHVVGTFSDSSTVTQDFTVDETTSTDEFFNWSNLVNVSFTSSGGTPPASITVLSGPAAHFSLDNLTIAVVPEPSSMILMSAGLIGLVYARRRTASKTST